MRRTILSLALMFCTGCLCLCVTLATGCKIILKDDGEVGFKQSTSWGFYHRASTTNSTSTSETKPMTLDAWFRNEKAKATIAEPTIP